MKKLITLVALFLIVNQELSAQNYLPVPTTGYTLDAVAENTTALSTTSGALDGGGNAFYSQSYGTIVGSTYGLPNSGLLTSTTRTFQLQSYTSSNCLFLPLSNQADTLVLLTPAAFSTLSLLGFATETNGTMSVTVRFTDNSSQVFSGIAVNDWFNASTPFASGFDRLARATGVLENVGAAGNPRFFTHDLALSCANQSKLVKRIIIKNTSSSSKICMWALSGVAVPLIASAAPAGLCGAGTSTLSATGLGTYTWLPTGTFAGASGSTAIVSPTATTEYTVQSVTAQNCTLNSMITVNIYNVAPTLTISNTANAGGICPTTTINLTASGAVTYTWAGGANPITNGVAFAPTTGGNYTVTGTNACGTGSAVTSVSIHPLPTVIPAASASTLCAGTTLSLTASGNATNYVWFGGTAPSGNGVGFVPLAGSYNYSVIGTSALTCTAMATMPVTVYATPNASPVANSTLICIGTSATLTASGATSYTWASTTQTITNNAQFVVTPPSPGVTSYTVTKANSSCADTKVISITTNSLPTIVAAASPTQVCSMQPSTVSATGGISYSWTAVGSPNISFTGASHAVYPASSTSYSVIASDGTCTNTTVVSVSAIANPTITTSASVPSICVGQQVTVNAFGGINYTWTATSGTFNTASVTDSPTTTILYTATGNNAAGCTSSAQQLVFVQPNPAISVVASMLLVCNGDASTLTATGADTYTWDPSAGSPVGGITVVNPVSATSGALTYSVSGSYSATGCQSSQTVQVSVYVPNITVSSGTAICLGGHASIGSDVADSYAWSNGSTMQNITVSPTLTTVYTVTAMVNNLNGLSCPATNTVQVSVNPLPAITATSNHTAICINTSAILTASGAITYTWTGGSGAVTNATISVAPIATQNYSVVGTDANGCKATAVYQLVVSPCTGISEIAANAALAIYPNPNNGNFTVKADGNMNITLTNELGEAVRHMSLLQENNYEVSLSDLPDGIYFLSGKADTYSFRKKIIVTK